MTPTVLDQSDITDDMPWMDIRLSPETMNYLWDIINQRKHDEIVNRGLAGNISKSNYVQDKDNWFYESVLKQYSEHMFYKQGSSYYDIHVTKTKSLPVFRLESMWVNYQKQHEFNPPHVHDGFYSFVIFMKIPTHWKEQHALPFSVNSSTPCASDFQFLSGVPIPNIVLSPEDEGRMLFFHASLPHQVFPFYGTEEERVTLSGNII